MLGVIAKALGVRYEETLTGFKWIANRAMDLERAEGLRFVFGFEEALGYTVGDNVRDKDGISAAVIAAELAARRAAEGKTLLDELEALSRRYGLFVSGQKSITLPGAEGVAQIGEIMKKLRASPPAKIGEHAVVSTSDYEAQSRRAAGGAEEAGAPAEQCARLRARGREPDHRAAERHGAEDQVLLRSPRADARGRVGGRRREAGRATMEALSKAFSAIAGVA